MFIEGLIKLFNYLLFGPIVIFWKFYLSIIIFVIKIFLPDSGFKTFYVYHMVKLLKIQYGMDFLDWFLTPFFSTRILLHLCFLMPVIFFYYIAIMLKYDPQNFIHYNEIKEKELKLYEESCSIKRKPWNLRYPFPPFPTLYGEYRNFYMKTVGEREKFREYLRLVTLNSRRRLLLNGQHWRNKTGVIIMMSNASVSYAQLAHPEKYAISALLEVSNTRYKNYVFTEEYKLKQQSYGVPFYLRRTRSRNTIERLFNFFCCFGVFLVYFCYLIV